MKKIIFFLILIFKISFSVDTKELTVVAKDKNLDIEMNIPSFYKNGEYMTGLNNKILGKNLALREMVQMESRKDLYDNSIYGGRRFVLKSQFEKIENSIGIDSYVIKTFYYIGGDHGMLLEEGINFKDGREVFLKDLFKDGINYKGLIKQKIEEYILKYGGDIYFDDINIPQDNYGFFFKGDSLVIIFNPYILASYEAGIVSFEISVSEIKDFMKI